MSLLKAFKRDKFFQYSVFHEKIFLCQTLTKIFLTFSVPNYEIVQIHSVRHKRSPSSTSNQADIHRVNLATHGRQLRLELRPNPHLVPQSRQLDLWYADAFPTNVSYSPVEKVRNIESLDFQNQCCQLQCSKTSVKLAFFQ